MEVKSDYECRLTRQYVVFPCQYTVSYYFVHTRYRYPVLIIKTVLKKISKNKAIFKGWKRSFDDGKNARW